MTIKTAKIELASHTVCSHMDLEELMAQGLARPWEPSNSRHKIFHQMKYLGVKTWHGNWGNELIVHEPLSDFYQVWSTDSRADAIRQWIQDSLWNP
jgi:hypothetical protein